MNILHTADWHIGNFPGPESNGHNLRADDTGMCINHLHDMALLRQPDIILISGDIFHQARVWADRGLHEVEVAIRAIEALAKICPVIVMRGTPNHDGEEQFSMLEAHFGGDDSVHVVTKPTVLTIKGYKLSHRWMNVACLPGFDRGVYRAKFPGLSKEEENQVFTEEISRIALALKAQCNPDLPSVLMSHYTVPGCNTESGQTQFLAQFEPVLLPDALDAAAFDLVALGHIHRPQQVKSCQNTFYSGAINAMNFNDEGQERGFWIHEIDPDMPYDRLVKSTFFKTPIREFLTIRLGPDEIEAYLTGGFEMIASASVYAAKDKVVRVLYSCTDEQNKALNRAEMEKDLYDYCHVFWVSEISPEKVTISTNKNELSELMNAESNLVAYLTEKGVPDIRVGEIVEAARPIISEAEAGNITSRHSGVFTPLRIEVKNYRNYEAEAFDFTDITFCTINGKNGAGKSSLFMDAILDCLYEEPREGDLTGWIRADEKARSGSISFTFSIGEQTFRVTRTRAKSGKATLNLAELADGEWVNRSSERMKDTQDQIIGILGMDSLTFRSCALIMQDQYGLFLQAGKEERMAILGNILGLGVYNDMEQLSRNKLGDLNREIAKRKTVIDAMKMDTANEDDLLSREKTVSTLSAGITSEISAMMQHRDDINRRLSACTEAAERVSKLSIDIGALNKKKADAEAQRRAQEQIIHEADELLNDEARIVELAAMYPAAVEEEKVYLQQRAALCEKKTALSTAEDDVRKAEREYRTMLDEKTSLNQRIDAGRQKLESEPALRDAFDRFIAERDAITAMEEKAPRYISISKQIADLTQLRSDLYRAFEVEASQRKNTILQYESKAAMLDNSGCCDIENASCVFLADAKSASAALSVYRAESTEWKHTKTDEIEKLDKEINVLRYALADLGYDPESAAKRRNSLVPLERLAKQYEQLDSVREQMTLMDERVTALDGSILAAQERLTQAKERAAAYALIDDQIKQMSQHYTILKGRLATAECWRDKENALPLSREKKCTAEKRLSEISAEISVILEETSAKSSEYATACSEAMPGTLKSELDEITQQIGIRQSSGDELQREMGSIKRNLEIIEKKKSDILAVQSEISEIAEQASIYDTLKAAFSQDGIPHNIIRSMLPMLTTTANAILSQMTGGKMGMEFVTDKVLKSNSKKEVPTLDIVIEEFGKDSLPYLSKSGGEKVKTSLSAILALAETKSSQAGIQLGMLFIDEPPFLDGDGIQAYCDALETIQRRYGNLKIMAITHDPTMKARFPQSIDIVKTDNGSRVDMN